MTIVPCHLCTQQLIHQSKHLLHIQLIQWWHTVERESLINGFDVEFGGIVTRHHYHGLVHLWIHHLHRLHHMEQIELCGVVDHFSYMHLAVAGVMEELGDIEPSVHISHIVPLLLLICQ